MDKMLWIPVVKMGMERAVKVWSKYGQSEIEGEQSGPHRIKAFLILACPLTSLLTPGLTAL